MALKQGTATMVVANARQGTATPISNFTEDGLTMSGDGDTPGFATLSCTTGWRCCAARTEPDIHNTNSSIRQGGYAFGEPRSAVLTAKQTF
jgi:hypothetical protein